MTSLTAGRILLRVEANAELGLGHAVRSSVLVDALGWAEAPIVVGEGPLLPTLFSEAEILPPAHFAELAAEAPLIIIDHPNPRVADLDASGLKVVVDDGGEIRTADIIVAGGGPPGRHAYPRLGNEALRLCGPRYALLREPFSWGRWRARTQEEPRAVLVAGSGRNAADWLLGVLECADLFPTPSAIEVVIGASFARRERLQDLCEDRGIPVGCGLSAEDLANRLSSASLAVVTGGMIVPETLALGVPCVAFPNEPDLVDEISWLHEQNALFGLDPSSDPSETWRRANQLLSNPVRAEALAASGRQLFDGRGATRVAEAIEARLSGSERICA